MTSFCDIRQSHHQDAQIYYYKVSLVNSSFLISRIAHNVIIDHYRDLKSCHIVETPRDKDLQNMKVASVLEMDHERNMSNQQVPEAADARRLREFRPARQPAGGGVYMRYFEDMPLQGHSQGDRRQHQHRTKGACATPSITCAGCRASTTSI